MTRSCGLALLALLSFACHAGAGSLANLQFTTYSPLSSDLEMARRLLSPLTAARVPRLQAGLSTQTINLSEERFMVYVPSQVPADGYGLLVFVPPWSEARLPEGWDNVLDRYGVIFVSAAHSGNDANVFTRRMPLALLAEQNIVQRYPVNPARVFIGGFSGGSRVAMRLALGYPDVFRGAFLDAGADPIGTATIPLPSRGLFEQFQTSSRLVYATGDNDVSSLAMAAASRRSMQDWCVLHVQAQRIPGGFHAIAGPAVLSQALAALMEPLQPDTGWLAACRSGIDAKLSLELEHVQSLITAGQRDAAQEAVKAIDLEFGGLAAPRSIELDQQISRLPK